MKKNFHRKTQTRSVSNLRKETLAKFVVYGGSNLTDAPRYAQADPHRVDAEFRPDHLQSMDRLLENMDEA